ncbi:hypothetical protein ACTXT7_013928, partial [Hymenolepis weldensis]
MALAVKQSIGNGNKNAVNDAVINMHIYQVRCREIDAHQRTFNDWANVSNLPPLDVCLKSPGAICSGFNRGSMGDNNGSNGGGGAGGGLDDSYFTTIDVDDEEDEDDAFFDVSGGSAVPGDQSPMTSFSPPSNSNFLQPSLPMLADTGYSKPGEENTMSSNGGWPRSNSPVLQEDEFPTYTVAPTVLADLPSSFEIRRNTQVASSFFSRQTADSGATVEDDATIQQCIALSPLGTCLLFSETPPSTPLPISAAATAFSELTLKRRQGQSEDTSSSQPTSSPPVAEQKPISLTIYSILAQSHAKFTLVKSRELRLPAQIGDRVNQVTVVTASISLDDSMVIVGLSNGRLWVYSLDEIGWVVCISSSIPLKANPLFSALMSARTPRPRPECSPLDTSA